MNHANSATASSVVRRGYSAHSNPSDAVRELREQFGEVSGAWIVFFCSPDYDFPALATALKTGFEGATVIGCTSSGHHGPQGYVREGIAASCIRSEGLWAETSLISDLSEITLERASGAARDLSARVAQKHSRPDSENSFAFLLCDGLVGREEVLAMGLNMGLEGIRLLGGSAADGGRLEGTWVYHDGAFHQNVAVLTLIRTDHQFHVFKHAHFDPTQTRMVVTKARPELRIVDRINGRPAAAEFGRIIGVEVKPNDPFQFSHYPVMVRYGAEHYLRTPMEVDPAGPVRFACAIEEGGVLTTSEPRDMVESLRGALDEVRDVLGTPDLLIGCDCTGRYKEMELNGLTAPISELLESANTVCFATYGEQLDSMHINQTFTGVAIRV